MALRPSLPSRRRFASAALATAAFAAFAALAPAAAAAIPDQEGTVTRSATATWDVGDPRNTTVTVTVTVKQTSAGGTVATTRTIDLSLIQDWCDTSGAQDLHVYTVMGETLVDGRHIEAFEKGYQKAKGHTHSPFTLHGTITYTPVGHNNTCAVATGPSQTDTYLALGKIEAEWSPATGSTPTSGVVGDTFTFTRDAVAKGKIEFKPLALKHYLLKEDASGAVLSVVAQATDGSDPSTMFAIKP